MDPKLTATDATVDGMNKPFEQLKFQSTISVKPLRRRGKTPSL